MAADALIDPTSPSVKGPTMKFVHPSGSQPLEGFTIARGLGRGGFGEVYLATTDAGKEVALKLIQRSLETELRGVQTCINLKHPNLVEIYDVREDRSGDAWIVMEYVAGERMEDVLERSPNGLSEFETRAWVEGAMEGLAYLHERGVVHRDVKPGNLFREDGRVKLGDYGLSKFLTASRRSGHTESIGTVHYMAPEVSRGKYGKEIDLYAVGVILYECLCGRRPFDGESMAEILMKHLASAPDMTAIPAPYRPVVAALLEKDPARRVGSVDALRRRLPPFPALSGTASAVSADAPALDPNADAAAKLILAGQTHHSGEERLGGAAQAAPAAPVAGPDLFAAWPVKERTKPAPEGWGARDRGTPPVRSRGFDTTIGSDAGREHAPHAAGAADAAKEKPAPRFGDWIPPAREAETVAAFGAHPGRPDEPVATAVREMWRSLKDQPVKKFVAVVLLFMAGFALGPVVWFGLCCYLVYRIVWEAAHSFLYTDSFETNRPRMRLGFPENPPLAVPPNPPRPPAAPSPPAAGPTPFEAALAAFPQARKTRHRPLFTLEEGEWPTGPFPAKGFARSLEEFAASAFLALVWTSLGAFAWALATRWKAGGGPPIEAATLLGATAAATAWAALAAGKLCEGNAPSWRSRWLFAAAGAAAGVFSGSLAAWVAGPVERGARDSATLLGWGLGFALVFVLARWHRLPHPMRPSSWGAAAPIFSLLFALCVNEAGGLQAGWLPGAFFLGALAVQLSAPHQRKAWIGWMLRREAALNALADEVRDGRPADQVGAAEPATAAVKEPSPPPRVRTAWPKRCGAAAFAVLLLLGFAATALLFFSKC